MKVILTPSEVARALRMFAAIKTNQKPDFTKAISIDPSKKFEATVDMVDSSESVPFPTISSKVITQEEVDAVYSAIAKRQPDVS